MPLFPLPAVISIIIWLFIFATGERAIMEIALGIIGIGILLFFLIRFPEPAAALPEEQG